MLKTFAIQDNRVVEAGSGPIQVYIAPTEEEKRLLVQDYKLDEHTFNSALDPDELARLEFEPEHAAAIFKRPRNYSGKDGAMFKVSSCGVFLFKDRLVIVQNEDLPLFEGRQFNRVCSLTEVVLKLIFRSIYHFLEHLKVINAVSAELEQKVNRAMENRYLINMFGLEKSLTYYVSAINSNQMLLDKLKANQPKLGFSTEELELLDDILIENNQCQRQAEIYANILASLMDARVSVVSNNLNVLMKNLTIITIGLMVPTLVVSIFSMNVPLPFGLGSSPTAFWLVFGLACVADIAFLLVWFLRRR